MGRRTPRPETRSFRAPVRDAADASGAVFKLSRRAQAPGELAPTVRWAFEVPAPYPAACAALGSDGDPLAHDERIQH